MADATDLMILSLSAAARVDSGARFQYYVQIADISYPPVEPKSVLLRVELPAGTSFIQAELAQGWSCDESGNVFSCSIARLTLNDTRIFYLDVVAPSLPRGGVLTARATVSSETPDPDPSNNSRTAVTRVERPYSVSSDSDSGPGSLRATLEEANRDCDRDGVPCRINFQIPPPVPESGWFTIRLSTPLPPMTAADLVLDGESQTSFTGDTNPAGPEVFLDGELVETGNGLEVRSQGDFQVSGLVISGFPENGILFDASARSSFTSAYLVANNYIGTDPTGRAAVPNRLRGIAVFLEPFVLPPSPLVQLPRANLTARSNVISGNGRSGIFINSGNFLFFEDNRIGVKASSDEPLPNGASGIYLGVAAGWGCVDHNLIAHNNDFGIALEKQVPNVWIAQNSIKGNRLFGLDIGLDLATPGGSGNVVGRPVITSARFDEGTSTTTVVGKLPGSQSLFAIDMVDVYSNASLEAKGEGETWLGVAQRISPTDFILHYPGSLLGKAITATVTRTDYEGFAVDGENATTALPLCQSQGFLRQTSEFSDPVDVTR